MVLSHANIICCYLATGVKQEHVLVSACMITIRRFHRAIRLLSLESKLMKLDYNLWHDVI